MSERVTGRSGDQAAAAVRQVASVAGAVLAVTGLAACGGGDTTPGNDEYAGRAQSAGPTTAAPTAQTTPASPQTPTAAPSPTGGPYGDGDYTVNEAYGTVDDRVEEDSIDVTLTLESGLISRVKVIGHADSARSQGYIRDFSQQINGAVVGHSVEDAHVTALAGASKTSGAFNRAVDAIAEHARSAAASAAPSDPSEG